MKNIFFFIVITLCIVPLLTAQNSSANYTITFTSNWSQSTHPHPSGNLPSNAHWSKLVGATHKNTVTFLEMGQIASQGIENIAELGSNNVFFSEVDNAITAGTANQIIDGDGLGSALGQIVISDVITSMEFPHITLASMIAPSPDWFVAVNSIPLLDGSNQWMETIQIDLYPYDAGTDSGLDYESPDNDTNPKEPIASAQGVTPFSSEKIGTLTIQLDSILGNTDFELANSIKLFPNPAKDLIQVNAGNKILRSIEIVNILGEKVMTVAGSNKSELAIDLTDLSSGIYLVKITDTGNSTSTKKVVKL
jgi:hypothetical protein